MRLKQIKLAGFKSFVDPTKIELPKAITAIVGPNGCGKSNVIDAVRWVLGESSAKHLRGDAMTDVIFNGSRHRAAIGQASVELVFEECDQRLSAEYAQFNEISIKRSVNREGQSQYYLNGKKCRRRDVTDLFMGTGLGARSYAIIEQGMISRLIESKPRELRVFIEEAAGISKYKDRRRETENRIRHTRENLERLADIRLELGNQLSRLQRQANAAQRYKEHKAKIRQLEAQQSALLWQNCNEQTNDIKQQLSKLSLEKERLTAEQVSSQLSITQLQSELTEHQDQEKHSTQQVFSLSKQANAAEQKLFVMKQASERYQTDYQQAQSALVEAQQEQAQSQQQLQDWQQQLQLLAPKLEAAQKRDQRLNQRLTEASALHQSSTLQSVQQQLQAVQQQQMTLTAEQAKLQAQLTAKRQQLSELTQIDEHEIEALQQQLEAQQAALLQAQTQHQDGQFEIQILADNISDVQDQISEQNQLERDLLARLSELKGQHKALESQLQDANPDGNYQVYQAIEVAPQWQKAVSAILSEVMTAEVVDSDSQPPHGAFAEQGMQRLSLQDDVSINSRINLLPWLSQVRFAQDEQAASALLDNLSKEQMITLADGQIWGQGFRLKAKQSMDILSLQSRVQELNLQLEAAQQEVATAQAHRETLNEQLVQRNSQYQQAQQQQQHAQQQEAQLSLQCQHTQAQQQALQEQQQAQQQKQQTLQQDIDALTQALADNSTASNGLALELEQHQQAVVNEQQQQQALASKLDELNQQSRSAQRELLTVTGEQQQLASQIETLQPVLEKAIALEQSTQEALQQLQRNRPTQENMDALEQELQQLLTQQSQAQQSTEQKRQHHHQTQSQLQQVMATKEQTGKALQQLAEQFNELDVQRASLTTQADNYLAQLNQHYSHPSQLSLLLEEIDADATPESLQRTLQQIKLKVERLGPINLAAVEEYETESQRKRYLDEQDADLTQALASLENAIKTIDKETRSKFKNTFDNINQGFGDLFPQVFGGGKAWLQLDDDDLLNSGVSIMAQPPGKRNSTIHLLSGGEKALTALSLVFAIFKLNPAPFCLLDEVDAPLDDANVGRFCALLEQMANEVQFVYISHNKVTMELAQQLTGVTMHEAGASRIVSVDIDEALAFADAG
ncbi:AAA family ATPase [Paraferrimonas haliotis]|uniref:Chromosome partition protein Smc n=1 Tax=Paraferrimonas haliotis TaxID=2013866 RepID=A0AA37WX62_9GAMM|nr:AAA family ATPase [Paraferrimonas haliotis]GLS84303.1 chromosome partition protein Smc [Paraferrimonas haliotis]